MLLYWEDSVAALSHLNTGLLGESRLLGGVLFKVYVSDFLDYKRMTMFNSSTYALLKTWKLIERPLTFPVF